MLLSQIKQLANDYGLTRLSVESGVSRTQIHKIVSGQSSPSLETLTKLLTTLGYNLTIKEGAGSTLDMTKIDDLKFSMAYYGAPLIIPAETKDKYKNHPLPNLETVLIYALRYGRSYAEINTVMPIFIHKNITNINLQSLIGQFEDLQYLGYILDLLYRLTSDRKYIMAISKLNIDSLDLKTKTLVKRMPKNKFQDAFFHRAINPAAESWKFRTGDSFDHIRQRFDKWSGVDLHQERH